MAPHHADNIVVAFDAYGTLLSTESIAKKLAESFGDDKAQKIAADWRKYQLEYTWRLNSMNKYEDFSAITLHSLKHAATDAGVSLEQPQIDELMKAYDSLSCFPDVGPCLSKIADEKGMTAVVFSNGTRSMVSNSVNQSPDLAPHAKVFHRIVVVEEVKKFKPAPAVYELLAAKMNKTSGEMNSIWLVSGNPFDVVGARAMGMKAAWVDRQGNGWTDQLVQGEAGRPTVILRSLEELVDAIKKPHSS